MLPPSPDEVEISPIRSLVGENVLTVLLSQSLPGKRMFFDPYTRSPVSQYQGHINAIYPGYDPEGAFVFVRPQREHKNIHYSFVVVDQTQNETSFYIQDQYFKEEVVQTYFCHQCQAPQLYFSETKVVHFNSKSELKKGDHFTCANPFCNLKERYLGIVAIIEPEGLNN